jgi:predicted dienelactone hydrolase
MRNLRIVACAVVVALAGWSAAAHAGPSLSAKCQAAKLKAAGKACDCRHATMAKALAKGTTPDFTKCADKLAAAFAKAEAKGSCPATGEGATVDGRLAGLAGDLETALGAGMASGSAASCVAAKLKAAGKQCACLHKTWAGAALKRLTDPVFAACDAKLEAAYAKAESKAGGACPTAGDGAAVADQVRAASAEVEADVADRDTATYGQFGPYGIGIRTVTLVDASRPTAPNGVYPGAPDRTLVTDVWYPAGTFDPNERPNAAIAATGGPFPLIVRAHGFSGFKSDQRYLLRQLASWGYVVVAPDFPLSNLNAPGGPVLTDVGEQALDVQFLIDTHLAANADPASFLFGRIAPDRIGTLGHSLGGATVLLATYHATLRDPRIAATVALSPLACVFLDGFFDTSTVPLMIQGGTVDMITPYASNQLGPYGLVHAPKSLLTFDGGTHLGFSDRLLWGANQNGDAEVGCSIFVGPGDPRPVTLDPGLPADFLGGPALGVDPTAAMCEPICPLPPASFMLHARQNALTKAGTLSFFEAQLRASVSGRRMLTGRLDAENADATLVFEE